MKFGTEVVCSIRLTAATISCPFLLAATTTHCTAIMLVRPKTEAHIEFRECVFEELREGVKERETGADRLTVGP